MKRDHRLAHTGNDFELVAQEHLKGILGARERRVLERASEKEVIRGAFVDRDAHTRTIDLGIARKAGIRRTA